MPTYRWRLACDSSRPSHRIFERFWTSKNQVDRVRQATYCWGGKLDADRSSFGYRRLILEGVVEQPSAMAAQDYALHTARWTLAQMYGLREYGNPAVRQDPPHLDLRVREIEA